MRSDMEEECKGVIPSSSSPKFVIVCEVEFSSEYDHERVPCGRRM